MAPLKSRTLRQLCFSIVTTGDICRMLFWMEAVLDELWRIEGNGMEAAMGPSACWDGPGAERGAL